MRVTPRPRRGLGLVVGLLVSGLLAVGLSACGSTSSSSQKYEVRAIFDDAGNVIAGENVRIAGVNVGVVSSLDVTPQQKAAVVLDITNQGFQDFRSDASCIVRPQALIGEMFVECTPTQPRAVGTPEPPPLSVVPKGQPGAGEYYLPVTNTSSPVGLDLIGDVARLPYTQRLTIIINELGAGLAGNGTALTQVVERADPALEAIDKVLAILASENHTLAQLSTDSNQVVAPLTRDRAQIADFIDQSNTVATVSAEHRVALGESLQKLPGFLDQLVPTLQDLSRLTGQANPVLSNLTAAAPAVNSAVTNTPAFASATQNYLVSFGKVGQKGVSQIQQAQPLVSDLGQLGSASSPFSKATSTLLSGLQKQGGLRDILAFLFRASLATNGYDSLGHFIRSFSVIVNPCINYQSSTANSAACIANFLPGGASASSARAARTHGSSAEIARTSASAGTASAPSSSSSSSASTTNTLLSYLLGQ